MVQRGGEEVRIGGAALSSNAVLDSGSTVHIREAFTKIGSSTGPDMVWFDDTRKQADGEDTFELKVTNSAKGQVTTLEMFGYYFKGSATLLSQHLPFEDHMLTTEIVQDQRSVLLSHPDRQLQWKFSKDKDGLYKSKVGVSARPQNVVLAAGQQRVPTEIWHELDTHAQPSSQRWCGGKFGKHESSNRNRVHSVREGENEAYVLQNTQPQR